MKTKTTTLHVRDSINKPSVQRGALLIMLALACFALLPIAQATPPPGKGPPDGDLGNGNTAEGRAALFSLAAGIDNTAMGFQALFNNTTANYNTAVGYQALYSNTVDASNVFGQVFGNTAVGYQALYHSLTSSPPDDYGNTAGVDNTAVGYQALFSNTTGHHVTAMGNQALFSNTIGFGNTAVGTSALYSNIKGHRNVAYGNAALVSNTIGNQNTAIGRFALYNSTGDNNTAVGNEALLRNTGGSNIAIGQSAGHNLTTGDNNIDVGNFDNNSGTSTDVAGEANTIRIGIQGTQAATFVAGIYGASTSDTASTTPVVIDMNGNLGTAASSERFKRDVKPMDKSSDVILALKPVTFHYKNDSKDTPQFGLIAEDVAKANPNLVVSDGKGGIYTVRYDAVNAMLLNEFLKEHKKVEVLEATVAQLKTAAAQQQKDFTARLKEQDAKIQQVSAQVQVRKAAPQVVVNNK